MYLEKSKIYGPRAIRLLDIVQCSSFRSNCQTDRPTKPFNGFPVQISRLEPLFLSWFKKRFFWRQVDMLKNNSHRCILSILYWHPRKTWTLAIDGSPRTSWYYRQIKSHAPKIKWSLKTVWTMNGRMNPKDIFAMRNHAVGFNGFLLFHL